MNSQRYKNNQEIEEAARVLGIDHDSLYYYAWPQTFGSTAGPFGGIGGCAMTTFTIEAWVYGRVAAVFCNGRYLGQTDRFEYGWQFSKAEVQP